MKQQTQRILSVSNLPRRIHACRLRLLATASVFILSAATAFAAPPDLTNGGVPNTTTNLNLGPTGLRGWMYHVGADTSESRQIQVKVVDAGSPASGKLEVGDVILGANGTGANPVNFTTDARRSFADSINDAEARNPAELKVLRWRAGTTTTQTLTLATMGSYTATAPYNCPKSALILENALQSIMTSGETAGSYSFGTLALLAGNNTANPNNAARQARAQTEARALIPDAAQLANLTPPATGFLWGDPWGDGHKLIVLTEYYLQTNDALVLPAIAAYSKAVIGGQNTFGTYSHVYSSRWRDGTPNGPMRNLYGTVNNASMPGWLGLLLTKECGVINPDLVPAIQRASRFYSYYSGKSAIPYGEHEAAAGGHENNGKSGLAAVCFALESHRAVPQKFFAKMAVASTIERDIGHTGPYFNHLWAPIGAAVGGETAAASCFSRLRWHFDLSRRWNGKLSYETLGENSQQSGSSYYGFSPSIAPLLMYALPLRQLHITGRGHDPLRQLSSQDVSEAEAVDGYTAAPRTTIALIADLGNWSPFAQRSAAVELGNRPTETTALLPALHAMAMDPQGTSRVGATFALGYIGHASSAGILASLLSDPVNHVRYAAAVALREMPQSARAPHLNTVLTAAANNAAPLFPYNEEDPAHLSHASFGPLLFGSGGMVPSNLAGMDRNLLYPAIRAVAQNPVGACRSSLSSIYDNLNQTDYHALADTIVYSAYELTPADKMFAYQDRFAAQRAMKRFNTAEGVPLCLLAVEDAMYGDMSQQSLATLQLYAGSSKTVKPDPGVEAAMNFLIQSGTNATEAQAVLAAIAGDPNPAALTPLKSIQAITAGSTTLTLPARSTTLSVTASDLAKGDSVYTWRKIHGAGNVTFAPNGTGAAKDCVAIFDGTPGQYLFEVKMSDSKNLTEVTSTIAMTLNPVGGILPANNPPVANNQSASVPQATATPIVLTGSDPEGYVMDYRVTSQPTHGKLTGTAPYLLYTSDLSYAGPDGFTFEVQDSEGQISTATVNLTVTSVSSFPTAIYEPFNMTAGTLLQGQDGGVGLLGNWVGSGALGLTAGNLSFGAIPTTGNRLFRTAGGNGPASINTGTTLTDAGLMADGAVLWFSFLHRESDGNTNAQPAFLFGNGTFTNYYDQITSGGSGIGVRVGSGKSPQPIIFNAGAYSQGAVQTTIGLSQTALIVGKITWGATPTAPDIIQIYTPGTDLVLDTPTSHSAVLNQSNFNKLSMWGNGPTPEFDEIRFGPNYSSVLNGNSPFVADVTAPVPGIMAFQQTPIAASTSSISMVAVTAFDPNGVEYYFTCTAGGGNDSGWQDSPSYTDTGLTPGVLYSYTVKARDRSPALNQTAASPAASATINTQVFLHNFVGTQQVLAESVITTISLTVGTVTMVNDSGQPVGTVVAQTPSGDQNHPLGTSVNLTVSAGDFTAPTPDPASFSVAPFALNTSSISMTATTGSDTSGVEYLFTETSGNPGGSSSIWQDSPVYTDSGLSAATQYSYTVTLRDKSPNSNLTPPSSPVSATTNSIPAAQTWYWDGGTTDIFANGDGASAGGAGTWNTSILNWDVGNAAHHEWNNFAGKTASFGGTAGTVTITGGGVTVGDLQITSDAYTITGDTLTVGGTSNLQINVGANIQSILAGNFGLNKAGTGTLTLSGSNTFSGPISITGGTVSINSIANGGSASPLGQSSNAAANLLLGNATTLTYTGGAASSNRSFTINGTANGHGAIINANGSGALNLTSAAPIGYGTSNQTRTLTLTGANNSANTHILTAEIADNGSGLVSVVKSGTGSIWRLANANNSYAGATTIQGGTLTVATLANAGSASSIGSFATAGPSGLTLSGGTLNYTGISTTTDRGFTAIGATTKTIAVGTGVNLTLGASVKNETISGINFTATGAGSSVTISALTIAAGTNADFNISTNTPTVTIQNLNVTGSNVIAQRTGTALLNVGNLNGTGASGWLSNINVSGVISGYTGSVVLGGDVTLSGLSTFNTSVLVQQGGVYIYNSIKNVGGGASALGAPTTVANGTIAFGNGGNNPTLRYTGTGDTTNRVLYLKGSANTLNLEQAGTGQLHFTANTTAENTTVGNRTLNLTGSTTGTGEISGAIVQSMNNPTAVTKSGSGKWTISGTNTYTLGTNVNAGTLMIDGNNSAATGTITVAAGARLGGKGTLGANLNIASNGGLTFGISAPSASHDSLEIATGKALSFLGSSSITITSSGGAGPGTYTLVSGGGNIVSSLLPSLILPQNWNATLAIAGNQLLLTVISADNRAPVWSGNPVIGTNATEDLAYSSTLAGSASDLDAGAILTFAKVSGPAWLNVAADGTVSGTPDNSNVGNNSFTVSVSDGIAPAVETNLEISVINTNDAPVWSGNPVAEVIATEDSLFSGMLAGNASDADEGATLTFGKLSGPAWLNVAADGTVSGTPNNSNVGPNSFTVGVSDGIAPPVETTLNVMVLNTNDAPFWASNPINGANATEDAAYSGNLASSASDVDPGSALTFTKVSGPAWLSVAANGTLSGTPANSDVGVSTFTVSVSDGIASPLETSLNITVVNTNDAPVFTTSTIVLAGASENAPYLDQTLAGQATDADAGDTITYSKVSGPAWLAVAANGALSGTPPSSTAGLNSFVVRATDSASATVDATLQITVTVLPLPWTSVDIGTGMLAGSATFNSGTFIQAGSGVIGGTSDKLRFTYQTLTANGEIIARISALQNTGTSSRVGVMIRDSLATNSKQIFMGMSGSNAYRWTRRTATGGSTTSSNSSSGTIPNTWVRLVRSGTTITAYKSTDGTSWTTVGSTTNTTFSSNCYIGLAVGSGSNTTLNTSQFSNVSVKINVP